MASLADFLFSGVLVRFPELKLAYSEGQIGWIPYALERADNTWEYHSNWTRAKETIPEPPSTYYRGRIFGCFTNDVHGMASIAEVGEDNVCFETDYPHTDTTWPFARDEVERMTASLTDEQRYKVLRGNAIRMLDLDRDRERSAASRPWRQNSQVSSAVSAHARVLGEAVAEPAVHHRLLDERGGAPGVGDVDRAGGVAPRRRARAACARSAPSRPCTRSGWSTASCTENSMIGRRLCVPALAGFSDGSHHSCSRIVNAAQARRADRPSTSTTARRSSVASRIVSSNSASSSSSLPSKYW